MEKIGILELHRFNGIESHEIQTAEIKVSMVHADEEFMLLSISAPKPIKTLEDTAELGGQPEASISLFSKNGWNSDLVTGTRFEVPVVHDVRRNRDLVEFSYVSFEDLFDNEIQILEREEERVRLSWKGATQDMCFYDGSKPDAIFKLECWASIVKSG